MNKILWVLLSIYGLSAHCEGIQVRADRTDPDRLKKNHPDLKEDGVIQDWGSGVYVGKYHVLTCAHTLAGNERFFIKRDGVWTACAVKKLDKKADLALLETKVQGKPIEFVLLPSMVVSGAPGKFKDSETDPDTLISIRETVAELDGAYIKTNIEQGDSGGPVMVDGKLIGVIQSKEILDKQPYAKIIGVDKIAEFLASKP